MICSKKKAGVVQGQVRDRKRVKLGRVREEKEKFLSLTEFPDNLSLVAHLDYFCGWGGFTARFLRTPLN